VLIWQQLLAVHQVYRLKQAATVGNVAQIIFRSPHRVDLPLPVSLSLALEAQSTGLKVRVKKRLDEPYQVVTVDIHKRWPSLAVANVDTGKRNGVLNNVVVPLSSRQRFNHTGLNFDNALTGVN
jgi:hypothetical protein